MYLSLVAKMSLDELHQLNGQLLIQIQSKTILSMKFDFGFCFAFCFNYFNCTQQHSKLCSVYFYPLHTGRVTLCSLKKIVSYRVDKCL